MMKKYIIASIIALVCIPAARAQVKEVTHPSQLEFNKVGALWFHTDNAAGMAVTPLADYNQLSLSYNMEEGKYKLQQQGDSKGDLTVNTNGALTLGKTRLWGDFTFTNTTLRNTRFNSILLDPVYDMPYYVADPNTSWWKIQTYDMSVKAATPFLWDRIALGVSINYFSKAGAKQIDPRTTSYKYGISVVPSLVVKLAANHMLGLSGTYSNVFERTVPINSDSQQDQSVYLMKGLGNWSTAVVGSINGLKTFYYKQNLVGGALQYGYHGNFHILAEGKYNYRVTDVIQTPSKPERMGTTVRNSYGGNVQALFGDEYTSKIYADAYVNHTDGIEYVQELDDTYEVQQWVTIAKFIRSRYEFTAASLGYDFFAGKDNGYDWKIGVKGIYSNREDEYILPHSAFSAENLYGELNGAKTFTNQTCVILLKANLGYNYNLGGEFLYNGADANSQVVKLMYERDLAVMTANYLMAGLGVNASFPISGKVAMYLGAEAQYLRNVTEASRIQAPRRVFAGLTLGFNF